MNMAKKYANCGKPKKPKTGLFRGDVFAASVINQKAVNQNAQQILVVASMQHMNLCEAQCGFATNSDSDFINT
jgi:hypothetical protein